MNRARHSIFKGECGASLPCCAAVTGSGFCPESRPLEANTEARAKTGFRLLLFFLHSFPEGDGNNAVSKCGRIAVAIAVLV